jgi:hypothetical protein
MFLPQIVTPCRIVIKKGIKSPDKTPSVVVQQGSDQTTPGTILLPTVATKSHSHIPSKAPIEEHKPKSAVVKHRSEVSRKEPAVREPPAAAKVVSNLKDRLHEICRSSVAVDDIPTVVDAAVGSDGKDSNEEDAISDTDCCVQYSVPKFTSMPMDVGLAVELKTLLLGSPHASFSTDWMRSGLTFLDAQSSCYVLTPRLGGTRAFISCVQAHVLRHLLFDSDSRASLSALCPDTERRRSALCSALASILWMAGQQNTSVIALETSQSFFTSTSTFTTDRITEKVMLVTCTTLSDTVLCLKDNLKQFESNHGVILMLFSVVLSRTVARVRSDMADTDKRSLITDDGLCTQELINLLLSGSAVSHLFNNQCQTSDGRLLFGVSGRCTVGFLTTAEYYKTVEVGSYLKTPRYPVWVARLSDSHFGVIYCIRSEILKDWRAERKFDLFYYDGQRHEGTVRLTIDNSRQSFYRCNNNDEDNSEESFVSPVELCICTKWQHAEVDWNGSTPIGC